MSYLGATLTTRQKSELEKAILDYLQMQGYSKSFQEFQIESGNQDFQPSENDRHHNLLAKKWTSVIRLQKKIIELESKMEECEEQLKTVGSRKGERSNEYLPQQTEHIQLSQHKGPITRVVFHPSYLVLATASEDMTIKIWDAETGEYERTLKGHTKSVQDIAFDPKGQYLVSCSSDLTIRIWDVQNEYKNIRTLYGHDHSVSSVCFMGPDRIVSASRDKSIKIWELSSGYCTKTIVGHAEWVRRASVSEDNRLLVTCSNDQSVRVWDGNTGECRLDLRGHENVVECAEFVPSNCYSSIANLLGLDPKIQPNTTPGRYVLSCSRDKLIKLWDSSGQPVHTFVGHDNWVRSLVFHPSGHFFLSVSDDKRLKVWDLKTGRCVRTIDAASHFVTTVAFCPIAPLLATGSVDTNATVWQCK